MARQPESSSLLREVGRVLRHYAGGTIRVSLILSGLYAVGFALLGVPAWPLFAIVCGFFNMIPMFGPVISIVLTAGLTWAAADFIRPWGPGSVCRRTGARRLLSDTEDPRAKAQPVPSRRLLRPCDRGDHVRFLWVAIRGSNYGCRTALVEAHRFPAGAIDRASIPRRSPKEECDSHSTSWREPAWIREAGSRAGLNGASLGLIRRELDINFAEAGVRVGCWIVGQGVGVRRSSSMVRKAAACVCQLLAK